jgi:hypothetical protein
LESFLMRGEARESRLPGELIRPAVARERARSGAYDLVVVPACAGNRPDARPLPTGSAKVVQVLWLPADGLAAHAELPERVLLASSGVEHLVLGVVYGETVQRSTDVASAAAPDGPLWLEIAPPVRAPRQAARGLVREEDRIRADSVTATERLARGNAGHATEDLARGLALHAAAQRASSPFESLGQQVELDREALDRFVAHGTSGAPDVFTRGLWSGLCDVLRAQRDVGLVYDLVEPLEALWGDWPEGALALAWADLEELDPAAAALRLEPYVARRPLDRDLVLGLADALQRDGRSADAAGHLARLVERHPRDRPVRKALARAWLAAGDPRGRDLARELLREDFDDREVWALLSPLPAKPREPEEGNEPRAGGDPPRD